MHPMLTVLYLDAQRAELAQRARSRHFHLRDDARTDRSRRSRRWL